MNTHSDIPKGHHEPLVRLVKRTDIARKKAWIIRASAIILALCTGGIILLIMGHNPLPVYADMLNGSFGTATSRQEMIKLSVPLLGIAVAITPAFKMRFWNIGAQGQLLAGATAATYFAIFHSSMPGFLLIIVMMTAAVLAGGLWGLIPAFFKAKWGTNETLFTLMLNYIALGIVRYFQFGSWRNPASTGFPRIAMFDAAARLPRLFGVHIGWIFVLVLVAVMYFYLKYTKQGFEIAVVGESERTARYAGMNVGRIIMRTIFISGAIAGLVGFLLVSGADYTLSETTGITSAGHVGFTAITVAWMSHLNPVTMIFMAVFIAILSKGANTIHTNFGIPASVAGVLTGIILFFMLGCEFFINYKVVLRKRETLAAETAEGSGEDD